MAGDGPRRVLIIPGGPGSELPAGPLGLMMTVDWKHYLAAGYRVCFVTRPRNMPVGHSIADMAADHDNLPELTTSARPRMQSRPRASRHQAERPHLPWPVRVHASRSGSQSSRL
jgi:hypothetical protein